MTTVLPEPNPKRAVVLMSGGLDSSTVLAMALDEGYQCHGLNFDYGQRHKVEMLFAQAIAKHYDVPLHTFFLGALGNMGAPNIFFGANYIDYSGYPDCRQDYFDAVRRLARVSSKMGLEHGVSIWTPIITFTKKGIIRKGLHLGVPYGKTWSCYDPIWNPKVMAADPHNIEDYEFLACGACDSCILRIKGFIANRARDPLTYRDQVDESGLYDDNKRDSA